MKNKEASGLIGKQMYVFSHDVIVNFELYLFVPLISWCK